MKASTCQPGTEQWESYYSAILRRDLFQYDYRTHDGALFSCVGKSLEVCRAKRDAWLASYRMTVPA